MTVDNSSVLQRLAQVGRGKSARQLAESIDLLIRCGELPASTRLPTVRQLTEAMGLSTGTVAQALRILRKDGRISTHQRGGTYVSAVHVEPEQRASSDPWRVLDMINGSADLSLLPDLSGPLLAALHTPNLHSLTREDVTERLRNAVALFWPFEAEDWTTAGGGTESMLLAVEAAVPAGSIALVEEPVAPGLLDTMRDLGVRPVSVEADDEGLVPERLRQALQLKPAALIYQPAAPFAMRGGVSQKRIQALVPLLREISDIPWIIEDDALGPLSIEANTLGKAFPERVVRVCSFCRPYGVDLRNSVLGGSAELIRRIRSKRSHGVAVNSRILQNTLAELLLSKEVGKVIEKARSHYAARRENLLKALTEAGLEASSSREGLVVWVTVPNAALASESLARQGVIVASGARAFIEPPPTQHLRIGITQLPEDPALLRELAEMVAQAAADTGREYAD